MRGLFVSSILLLAALVLGACTVENGESALQQENQQLIERIVELEKQVVHAQNEKNRLAEELEVLKKGPAVLLAKARAYRNDQDYDNALATLTELVSKYPLAEEIETANTLQVAYESEKSEQLAAAAAEEERNQAEEARLAAEKEQRLKEATAAMNRTYDEVREISFYVDKSNSMYDDVNELSLYIAAPDKPDQKPSLRLRVKWTGEDWLFIDHYTFKIDDQTIEYGVSYSDVTRDNAYGEVWEYIDVLALTYEFKLINAILNGNKTIIRHSGDQYYEDRTVSDQEKKAMQRVLDAFEALGGVTR